jgi:protein gp37
VRETAIQWCDSSVNAQMGCAGCELWEPSRGVRRCYAGALHERFAGRKGWPESFGRPELFTHRLDEALRWADLRGRCRPDKPWLDGYPRTIFLNDMGDTFTEGLPVDWLSPHVPRLGTSPHVWIILTKRPGRMLEWVRLYQRRAGPLPRNVWLCVSVTTAGTLGRLAPVRGLRDELPGHVVGLSVEPLPADLAPVLRQHWPDLPSWLSWVKMGGESDQPGAPARPCAAEWLRGLRDFFCGGSTAVFVKQLGSNATEAGRRLRLRDGHGGDWGEWPEDLRVREMPLTPAVEMAPA